MSGLNISCGNYRADDKSGSAFERVISDLPGVADELKHQILAGFEDGEYVVIDAALAASLVPAICSYRDSLVGEIGHADYLREMEREEREARATPVELKWGEGRGWRLYCSINLQAACERAADTQEPVVVCLD
jgi:hypothetical protein